MLLPCVDCESVPTLETREGPTFHHITSKPSYFEAVVTCCTPKHTTRARDRRNAHAAVASVRKSWNKKMLSLQTQRVVEELERYLNMASERRDIWRVEEAVNELRSMRAYCEKIARRHVRKKSDEEDGDRAATS